MSPLLLCLSMIVYFEARGEPFEGQVSVAQVGRVRLERTIQNKQWTYVPELPCKGLVRKTRYTCAFTFYCDGRPEVIANRLAWRRTKTIAKLVLNGTLKEEKTIDATHYHTVDVRPYWADSLVRIGRIGNHIFYKGH